MNSQDTNKSSEQLQREVHGHIDKLGEDIDTIRSRMTPGSLLDDAIFYPHGQSLTGTYTHLRNNPMGSMFLSLGTLLLMEDQDHISYEDHFKSSASHAWDKGVDQYHDTKDALSDKTSEWSDKARSTARRARDVVQEKAQEWRGKAKSAKEDLEAGARELERGAESKTSSFLDKAKELTNRGVEKLQSATGSSKESLEHAKGTSRERFESAKESLEHAKEASRQRLESAKERLSDISPLGQAMHPYAIASMGLGIGASLGASISPPERVRSKLHEEKYRSQIRRMSEEFDDAIRESGERIKNRLIDELKEVKFH